MNCPKCTGLLARDYGLEHETKSKPAYKCANCSYQIDMRMEINRGLTVEQQTALTVRPKGTPQHRGPQAVRVFSLSRAGGVVCDTQH